MRLFSFIFTFWFSLHAQAAWVGTYASTAQQGMAVDLDLNSNQYVLYITENHQTTLIEAGTLQSDGQQLQFFPTSSINANAQATQATITQMDCTFNWGEAGTFMNVNSAACTSATNTQNNAQTTTNVVSILGYNPYEGRTQLLIPQLGIPNANGGFDVYAVLLQIDDSYTQFQMIGLQPVANPVNALSAVYSPEQFVIYIPVIAFNMGDGTLLPLYEIFLQVVAMNPVVVLTPYQLVQTDTTQTQSYQVTPPTQDPLNNAQSTYTDPTLIKMMSDINQMSHDTSMSIISNMSDNSCYGYSYQCY